MRGKTIIRILAILWTCCVISLTSGCSPNMRYRTAEELSGAYEAYQDNFDELAGILWGLWDDGQYGLTRICTDSDIPGVPVVKHWNGLSFGAKTELPDEVCQSIYAVSQSLFEQAGLDGLCVSDKEIEFLFDWTYGYESVLYCMHQPNDDPIVGMQCTEELLIINEDWRAVIAHD